MLEKLAAADFENLPDGKVNAQFGVTGIVLEIAGVRQLGPSRLRASPPFAVLLRERGARRSLPQGTYVYEHPVHGPLELFTVPVGPDASGMCYEVTFN
jgi:hypothetical protein